MKVIVVSDTHGKNDNYFKLIEMHNPDMIIHCGDVEGSEYALTEAANCPVYMVKGNNDFFSELPKELEVQVENFKVWVTHGHTYGVSVGCGYIKEEASSRGANIVLFGHTHMPLIDKEGDVIAINPGSLSYPRQPGRQPSFAILETDRFGEWHFNIGYLKS